MMRCAVAADAPAIEDFLVRHAETSMFLRGNLEQHGIGVSSHPHATCFYLWEQGTEIIGVFGHTKDGYLMCQLPVEVPLDGLRAVLAGQMFRGMTGDPDQVARVLQALGMGDAEWSLQRDEPLYLLELADLVAPDVATRPPEIMDEPLLHQWVTQYELEIGHGIDDAASRERAKTRAAHLARGTGPEALLLLDHDTPVAMTAFNAQARDMVQIGGVFVPDDQRGKGYGGLAVAAHLARARPRGVRRAILFAASAAAARCYEKIGFRRIGSYRINMLPAPVTLAAQP